MPHNHCESISFGQCGDERTVTRNGKPDGVIRRFTRFNCNAWTYDQNGVSLVGPLPEVQATIRRIAMTRG